MKPEKNKKQFSKILIVCIGNDLVGDDGAGKAVYDSLQKYPLGPEVRLVYLGLGGIDLLEEIRGEELLIVVDAVQLHGEPGAVHLLEWEKLPRMQHRPVSGHGISVGDVIAVAGKLYPERCPGDTWLVGIEGECYDQLGAGLSDVVNRAVPSAVEKILSLI